MQEAVRAFVQEICDSIANGALDPIPTYPEKIWVRGDDGNFRPTQRPHSTVLSEELENRTSFPALAEEASADPLFGPQLGRLFGSTVATARLELVQIVQLLVSAMFTNGGRFEFQEELFQQRWDQIVGDLSATTFPFVTIAPLPSFVAPFPLEIGPNIVIDQFTDDELNRCWSTGLLSSISPSFELIYGDRAFGIRCTSNVDKADVVTTTLAKGKFGARTPLEGTTTAGDVLAALRLFKAGRVVSPGDVSTTEALMLTSGMHYRHRATRHPLDACDYEIKESEIEALQDLWKNLTRGTLEKHRFVDRALRRFNMAFERNQSEDRIVDHMIAAESLFLSESGDPRERGELRFRLALRASKFVESPRYGARQLYDLMREAYVVRSGVVHGGEFKTAALPDNPDANIGDFILAVEEIMRLGIKKALTEPKIADQGFWTGLLFP